ANDTLRYTDLSDAEKAQVTPSNASVSTIRFDSSLNGRTITLSAIGDDRVGPSAFLINSPVVINGPSDNKGIALEVATEAPMRFFDVTSLGDLTLQNLTLRGGVSQGPDNLVAEHVADSGRGGAIFNQGRLTVVNSTLTGNTARG